MEFQVSLTDRCVLHLQEIGDHIAKESPASALRWIEEIERQILRLAKFPEGHPPARVNENHAIELRQMLYGKGRHQYRIIFTIQDAQVIVLDVCHGARLDLPPKDLD